VYLADGDIRALLAEIQFETDDPTHPFDPDDQIQPCSVDVRLDGTFWRQRSRKTIDLRRAKLLELSPRRYWSKIVLRRGDTITLRPGEMILGRTYETFSIPPTCAGKIEGRSSFGRMALSVHCTADFINPGWRGRMPLELVNVGRHTLQLFPLLPIGQVMFIRLSSRPQRLYGELSLFSKYMNDDGGPSYWWRDKRIQQLHVALAEHDATERVQREILDFIGPREPELIERFEKMIRRLRREDLTNSSDLLDRFARREDRLRLLTQVGRSALEVSLLS
jgi:deoxycytidine triphosphate deaminase